MLTCFVDDAGCPGKLPSITSRVQPLLVSAGIALDTSQIVPVSRAFARITQRFHYGQCRCTRCSGSSDRYRPPDARGSQLNGVPAAAMLGGGSEAEREFATFDLKWATAPTVARLGSPCGPPPPLL